MPGLHLSIASWIRGVSAFASSASFSAPPTAIIFASSFTHAAGITGSFTSRVSCPHALAATPAIAHTSTARIFSPPARTHLSLINIGPTSSSRHAKLAHAAEAGHQALLRIHIVQLRLERHQARSHNQRHKNKSHKKIMHRTVSPAKLNHVSAIDQVAPIHQLSVPKSR